MFISAVALSYGIAFSHHIGLDNSYNEVHPYIALTYEEDYSATAYLNSLGGLSVAAGYEFDIIENTSLTLGGVTGYGLEIAPYFKLDYELGNNVDLSFMPAYEKHNGENTLGLVAAVTFNF